MEGDAGECGSHSYGYIEHVVRAVLAHDRARGGFVWRAMLVSVGSNFYKQHGFEWVHSHK